MKKIIPALYLALILLFLPTASAERWEIAGAAFESTIWIDTASIHPVVLPDGKTKVPHLYQISTRIGKDDQGALTFINLIDIQAGTTYAQGTKKQQGWLKSKEGHAGIFDLAFLFANQSEISSRKPYVLTKKEASFGKRSPNSPIHKTGWQQSYENKEMGVGWIQTSSIQITAPQEHFLPSIRFLGKMQKKLQGDTMEIISLIEIDPNSPQKYQILAVWGRKKGKNWLPISNAADILRPLNVFSETSYLGTTAYEYLLTHSNEIQKRPHFTSGKNEKAPEEWLKLLEIQK